MYLALLEEKQKELFLSLAVELASSDGEYTQYEQQVIAGYCQEMQMEYEEEKLIKDVDVVLEELNRICQTREKRILIFECVGLAMADNNYDESEKALIIRMVQCFQLEEEFIGQCERMLQEYLDFQEKVNQVILG